MPTNAQMIKGMRADEDRAWNSLTPREQDVCKRSVRGLTNAQLAAEMGIKPYSVRKLKNHVRCKIGWRAKVYFG